jgi:hypothetical protein
MSTPIRKPPYAGPYGVPPVQLSSVPDYALPYGIPPVQPSSVPDYSSSFANINSGISGVDSRVRGVGNQVSGVGNQVNNLSGQVTGIGNQFSGLGTQVGQVGNNVTAQGNRLYDQADTTQGMLAGGFAGTGNQIEGVSSDVGDLEGRVAGGFSAAEQQATDSQTAILGGQASLSESLTDTSDQLNTYYGDLSSTQADIQSGIGGVQSGLDGFTTDYNRDATLAQQSRDNIQTGMMNQTGKIREDMGRTLGNIETSQSRNQATAQSGQADTLNALATMQTGQGMMRRTVDAGQGNTQGSVSAASNGPVQANNMAQQYPNQTMPSQDSVEAGQRRLFESVGGTYDNQGVPSLANLSQMPQARPAQGFENIRSMMAQVSSNPNIDINVRREFNEMNKAYSNNGELIPQSSNPDGSTTTRDMNDRGEMILRKYDTQGRKMGDLNIDINMRSEQLSQANTPDQTSGFAASPYSRTY